MKELGFIGDLLGYAQAISAFLQAFPELFFHFLAEAELLVDKETEIIF